MFYPGNANELRSMVSRLLSQAPMPDPQFSSPKAVIAPHAGYIYSGGVAASAYKYVESRRNQIKRVVLVGPSHRVYFRGVAVPTAEAFASPLGEVPVDVDLAGWLSRRGDVVESDAPHVMEHSLEVQVPFLQQTLLEFTLLPLVVGAATAQQVTDVLSAVWGDDETFIVASSDLSHYLPYEQAQVVDERTSAQILSMTTNLEPEQACGALPINGLLGAASQRGLRAHQIMRLNSGDTAGDRQRVVGYGAYAIH
jgi:AmmeMemoRadiSam system protein B